MLSEPIERKEEDEGWTSTNIQSPSSSSFRDVPVAFSSTSDTPITTNKKPQHHHHVQEGKPIEMRSRKSSSQNETGSSHFRRKRKRRHNHPDQQQEATTALGKCCKILQRSTISVAKVLAKVLLWASAVASIAGVVWYSNELKNNGADPHLIAWFSAGAFVLLGFPISIYGISTHLANYNKPDEQSYVVRILWMVPIYSIESWLCLRYKDYAIYIETLRDCYESYVLYSFFQYLIKVLGGEEQLVLLLKDKSPTRGVHMWGLQWCVKPWLMGQPMKRVVMKDSTTGTAPILLDNNSTSTNNGIHRQQQKPLKNVYWTSPFFVKCKFGVLQYVLLKFLCSIAVMILEKFNLYKEGDFTPKGGYLYICILTNTSQCWALYCLIFFYYSTKNELSPIRPIGKFLAVKALVFFTWWQSLGIAILYQMGLIPHYHSGSNGPLNEGIDSYIPLSAEDALALDEQGGLALDHSYLVTEWTSEDVAKGLQDYLICIEMFIAAIVHLFIFPHSEYDPQAVEARARMLNQQPNENWNKRLGRKWKEWDNKSSSGWSGTTNTSSEVELVSRRGNNGYLQNTSMISQKDSMDEDDLRIHPMDRMIVENSSILEQERKPLLSLDTVLSEGGVEESDDESYDSSSTGTDEENQLTKQELLPKRKQGFVSALLDSSIPQDLRDNTVGIIKGDYLVERKTLLHHAATSDTYDLFSRVPRLKIKKDPRLGK